MSHSDELLQRLGILGQRAGACDGAWINTDGTALTSHNPATGDLLGEVASAGPRDCERVLSAAEARFQSWRMRPAPQRGEVIRQLGNELRKHKHDLGALISAEVGKIHSEGLGEVQEMIDICDFAVGQSRQLYGLTMPSERPQHSMSERWHPLGPVGVITAFNFPMAVWAWNAAIAAVCGDVVVWKPSPNALMCSLAVQRLCNQVMAENDCAGVFGLLVGGADIGAWMANEPRLPLISFTGSIPVGRQVAAQVAGRLGRSILELGGNNAVIVMDDADLDLAIRAITFGAVGTAGQRCTSTRRVFAHRAIASRLTQALVNAYRSIKPGNPMAADTLLGPLISADAVRAFEDAVKTARDQGGEVLCGGNAIPGAGHYVEPTLIAAPKSGPLPIADEETFGPILYLYEVDSLDDAIAAHNAVSQGLSSAIFSDSMRSCERFLSAAGSDCGIANVNIGTSGAEIGGAFGGEKDSGGGRESGSDAWKAYMRRQTCTVNWSRELALAQGVEFTLD